MPLAVILNGAKKGIGVLLLSFPVLAAGPETFAEAKRYAYDIHRDHRVTFYCGCTYDKHRRIDLKSCGYQIQKNKRRAHRLEWEHIVPVSLWGKPLSCWKEKVCCKRKSCFKGRACCRQQNRRFAKMEADLHNLVPAIGEVNALRSNYPFGELFLIGPNPLGTCALKIDPVRQRVEPAQRIRGVIARAYLYMSNTYDLPLSQSQQALYQLWNRQHPPSRWEIEWDRRVFGVQGNYNPYIQFYEENK